MAYPSRPPEERFWPKVQKAETCWLWTGAKTPAGYGLFFIRYRPDGSQQNALAHRFAYELLVGSIPEGLNLDHVKANGCTSTLCVKAIADEHGPAHLEPVTQRENLARGETLPAINARKTCCFKGHPLTGDNLYIDPSGKRRCRECRRANSRRSWRNHREARMEQHRLWRQRQKRRG